MKVCFLSNYLTHHQLPFCLAMQRLTNGNFTFIETEVLTDERKKMGYRELGASFAFVRQLTEKNRVNVKSLINECCVVIIGSAPASLVLQRLRNNKLTFRYSERIFKKRNTDFPRLVKHTLLNLPYKAKNLYYLLSSAYAAADYIRCGADSNKLFRWGYFPETKKYPDLDSLLNRKRPASLLWVARMIGWKHPGIAIEIASRLKNDGYRFVLNMIGTGKNELKIRDLILQKRVDDCVVLLGAMSPERVREHMEQSEIFLFTSDRNEGWGAVLNEAMNSGCAVIANSAIGSVPFLINEENGLVYRDGNVDMLYESVKKLLDNPEARRTMGINAYKTITDEWCAELAADRFIHICEELLAGKPVFYKEGPCSKADILK